MMKKTYIRIYAIIALFIIVGTVAWFAYGVISDSDQGEIEAKNTFAYFAKSAIKLAEEGNFTEKAYKDKLIEIAEEAELKAFIISNLKSQALISWPVDSNLIVSDQTNGTHIEADSFFTKTFTVQIKVKTLNGFEKPLAITAALDTLKPGNIFVLSRSAFLIVLTVVILTLLMILLQSVMNSGQKVYAEVSPKRRFNSSEDNFNATASAPYNEPYEVYPAEELTQSESYEQAENPNNYEDDSYKNYPEQGSSYASVDNPKNNEADSSASYVETYSENYGTANQESEKRSYTLEDLDNLSITKGYPYEADSNDSTLVNEEVEKAHNVPVNENTNPYENEAEDFEVGTNEEIEYTFSERTGVNLESALKPVLEAELKRSAASENDMALLMVKLKDLTLESIVAKRIANLLFGIVKFKEMIFEYEEDGFAAILYDRNLDLAMQESEIIYEGIQSILDEYDISEPIAIGLTNRTDRLIDADRMVEEARAAIERAIRSADDPIVAFRVNPKKYREFISEN